ncbi:MAG: Ig-like domain-containing protein, partial [Actinomycetota bacterium]|nr:Ig-like domain-containing protein [Actinomycetota bacterium]
DYLTRAFEYIEQDPYVEVATWYNFRNNFWAGDTDSEGAQSGLMTTDFTPKPAYDAFKLYAGQGGVPTSPDPILVEPPPDPIPANEAPTVELTAPVEWATFTRNLPMAASATDDSSVVKVAFALDGKVVQTDFIAPYEYSYRAPRRLAYGAHSVTATAYDGQGLTGVDQAWVKRVR